MCQGSLLKDVSSCNPHINEKQVQLNSIRGDMSRRLPFGWDDQYKHISTTCWFPSPCYVLEIQHPVYPWQHTSQLRLIMFQELCVVSPTSWQQWYSSCPSLEESSVGQHICSLFWGLLSRNLSLWRRYHLSSSRFKEPQGSVFLGIKVTRNICFSLFGPVFPQASNCTKPQESRQQSHRPSHARTQLPQEHSLHTLIPWDVVCWYNHYDINSLCP